MDEKNSLSAVATLHFNQHHRNQLLGHRFKSVKPSAAGHADERLQAACREMESLFLSYLLKEMRASVDKSGFISGGKAEEIFTSLLDVEYSKRMSSAGGVGLASMLMKQLGGQSDKNQDPDAP
jgi:flagellar protein FlgJ